METSEPGGTKGRLAGRVRRAPGRLRAVVRSWGEATWSALSKPGPERDTALLVGKAALATVLAWQFAVRVLAA